MRTRVIKRRFVIRLLLTVILSALCMVATKALYDFYNDSLFDSMLMFLGRHRNISARILTSDITGYSNESVSDAQREKLLKAIAESQDRTGFFLYPCTLEHRESMVAAIEDIISRETALSFVESNFQKCQRMFKYAAHLKVIDLKLHHNLIVEEQGVLEEIERIVETEGKSASCYMRAETNKSKLGLLLCILHDKKRDAVEYLFQTSKTLKDKGVIDVYRIDDLLIELPSQRISHLTELLIHEGAEAHLISGPISDKLGEIFMRNKLEASQEAMAPVMKLSNLYDLEVLVSPFLHLYVTRLESEQGALKSVLTPEQFTTYQSVTAVDSDFARWAKLIIENLEQASLGKSRDSGVFGWSGLTIDNLGQASSQ